jgi:hypothetical protein
LFTWVHDYRREGVPVRQYEHVFLTRGPQREPAGDLTAAHVEDGILYWRWWPLAELPACPEKLLPPQLPELVAAVLRAAPQVPGPVDLGYVPLR